ncbi:MAG TPA: DUF2789 domain-containing protein [Rhodocyclaceae bacterium]|nr:DUF2789 domain-containing protein [Rhodocyclaceae bacterium]
MEAPFHSMDNLFAQLGLPADEVAIRRFIASHRPLPAGIQLFDASFWTPAQAAFLREQILVDADWAEVIDELNGELTELRTTG